MEADIFAVSASEADTNLENKEVNVLLLGPQVRFMKGQFEQKLQPKRDSFRCKLTWQIMA